MSTNIRELKVGRKLKFVLSDLHFGAGYTAKGGNLLEDFRADEMFVDFLHQVWHESEREEYEVELIINGDFFEFLQVPAVDTYDPSQTYPKEAYLASSQEDSIKRLNIIVEGHPRVFNALSDFMHVEATQRSLTIIMGNHDINLFWPTVKNRLREVLGASGMRASLLRFANHFVSREKIYIEHGHQYAEKFNSIDSLTEPFLANDPSQLCYPDGSRFVINFFNQVEPGWWFIDQIKPIPTLIWYALHWDFDFACDALLSFIENTSRLAAESPVFDHGLKTTIEKLTALINTEEQRRKTLQHYNNDPNFRIKLHRKIQKYLDGISQYETPSIHIMEDPREMGRAHQNQQHALLRHAANIISDREKARVVLFGHTHYPRQEKLSNGSTYINTGSWIEDFSDAPHETWTELFKGTRQPSRPPTPLPYARIEYDEHDNPTARLLYFNNQSELPLMTKTPTVERQKEGQNRNFIAKSFDKLTHFFRSGS